MKKSILIQFFFLTFISSSLAQYDINVTTYDASGVLICDGSIILELSNGDNPILYSFEWEGTNGFSSNEQNPDELCAGLYCVTVTNPECCQATKCFDICANLFISPNIQPPFCSDNDGLIELSVDGSNNSSTTYLWSNGSQESSLYNLSAGQYCVTVTQRCAGKSTISTVECYEVLPYEALSGNVIINLMPCVGISNSMGQANATGLGGKPPYSFFWDNGKTGINSGPLSVGNHNVTIVDGCLNTFVKTFTVPYAPIISIAQSLSGCPGNGHIDISASGGNPPYSYQWSHGPATEDVDINIDGQYSLIVTDANGCFAQKTSNIQFGHIEVEEVFQPCEGFHDGVLKILAFRSLHDQNLAIETIHFNNIPYAIESVGQNNPVELTISNLGGNRTYPMKVDYNNCESIEATYMLEDKPLEWVHDHVDEDLCISDLFCDEEFVAQSSTIATYDFINGSTIPCRVPILCEGVKVGNFKFDAVWLTGAEYYYGLEALLRTGSQAFPSYYLHNIVELVFGSDLSAINLFCDKFLVCLATMKPIGRAGLATYPVANSNNGWDGNCYNLKCYGWFNDIHFCWSDLSVNFDFTSEFENCDPRSYSFYQLVVWDQLGYLPSAINGTQLKLKIDQFKNDPRAKCATIGFCYPTYDVWHFDIEDIDCEGGITIVSPRYNGSSFFPYCSIVSNISHENELLEVGVLCKGREENLLSISYLPPPEFGYLKRSTINNQENFYFSELKGDNEYFSRFSFLHHESILFPKGIITNEDQENCFYDYSLKTEHAFRHIIPKIDFLILNGDKNETVSIQNIENNQKYNVVFDSPLTEWQTEIRSSESLKIDNFFYKTDEIIIQGTFKGELYFQSISISNAQANTKTAFVLKMSNSGDIIRFHSLTNLNVDSSPKFSEILNGEMIICAKYVDNRIGLDGSSLILSPLDGFVVIKLDTSDHLSLINTVDVSNSATQLLDISYAPNSGSYALAFNATGQLKVNGATFFSSISSNLVWATFDSNNQIKTYKSGNSNNVQLDKFDLTFGKNNDLFIGLTFSGLLKMFQDSINSIGDNDIIIAKFDSIGTEVWLERYGTTENENISNLFYDNDILYFGGEFSGLNRERIIGSNRFVNLSPSTQKAYMSYILDTLGNDFNSKFPKTVSAINPQKESPNTFEVFPNPFKNVFTIELYNKDIQHFELLDMLGNIVIHQDASFKNEINVQNLQAGMYLVKGIDKTGSVVEVKKIFKN